MTEIAFNAWYKEGDVKMFKYESADVLEGRKVAQGTGVER
jgi:hypothetical protein